LGKGKALLEGMAVVQINSKEIITMGQKILGVGDDGVTEPFGFCFVYFILYCLKENKQINYFSISSTYHTSIHFRPR
jgi:hypothetical protein